MVLGVLKPKLVLRGVQVSQKKPALVLRARRWPLAGDGSDAVRAKKQNLCQQSSLWQDVYELHSHGLWKHADTGGESHPLEKCTHVNESLTSPSPGTFWPPYFTSMLSVRANCFHSQHF